MTKKSRIIINNWSSVSDSLATFYVSEIIRKIERHPVTGAYFPKTFSPCTHNFDIHVAAFRNKSSDSFDVRDVQQPESGGG